MPNWIKNYRFDIYKDIIFWIIVVAWLTGNIVETYCTGEAFLLICFVLCLCLC